MYSKKCVESKIGQEFSISFFYIHTAAFRHFGNQLFISSYYDVRADATR